MTMPSNAPRDPIFDQAMDYLFAGRRGEVLLLLAESDAEIAASPDRLARASALYTQLGAHEAALGCHRRLAEHSPRDPNYLRGLAAAETATGRMAEAEAHLDEALALDPRGFDDYYNRATLRRQTPERNHIDQLLRILAEMAAGSPGEIPLGYALAKEFEDLGNYKASFAALKLGADRRRAALSYRVESDVEAMDAIAATFSADLLSTPVPGASTERPIFIVGLPRSGTTLLDRMMNSHAEMDSLGELTDFAVALTNGITGATGKLDFIARAGRLDFAALGRRYLASVAGFARSKALFIDKMPTNFLYIGLMRLALPNARVIHLRRAPLDSGYAIYKTLFRMGYPYSYSLDDLGSYLAAQSRLMDHWREAAPGFVLDVDYERLVEAPEQTVRTALDFCGLDWDPACLDFHKRAAPAATASAAQVREPIHTRSVGLWRHYEEQLAPLAYRLAAEGISVDA